jgi:hypothetical protein
MKNTTFLIAIIGLLSANGQQLIDTKKEMDKTIVQELNRPIKIWITGHWEFQLNGSKIWKKGHWEFEEKSFQQKSEILRRKMTERKQA